MSALEDLLALQLRGAKITGFEREVRFHPTRRWRFDFARTDILLGVEVEGTTSYGKNANGTMRLGRHQTAKGFAEDCVKYNTATLLGWRVLRFDGKAVREGVALDTIRTALTIARAGTQQAAGEKR